MIKVLSVENMRKSDAHTIETKTSSRNLMFCVGKAIFNVANEKNLWQGPVAVVCGSGNNAGDGYVLASLLFDSKIDCTIFRVSPKTSIDGAFYLNECLKRGIKTIDLSNIDICNEKNNEKDSNSRLCENYNTSTLFAGFNTIVDCIFGTGFLEDVTGPAKYAIEAINESCAYKISVDINSGLNGNNGLSNLCVISNLTVSVGSFKPGHFLNMAKDVIKDLTNCNIGIDNVEKPYWLLGHDDFKGVFKTRPNYCNKGDFGYIALIGGSLKYCGAIKLASMANVAMCSGAGVVKIATAQSLCYELTSQILESTLYPLSSTNGEILFVQEEIDDLMKNVKTIAFGMGIGVSRQIELMLSYILSSYTGILIIDADGLTVLSNLLKKDALILKKAKCSVVLTPHAKEFARLLDCPISSYMANPIEAAETFASKHNIAVLLKGPATIITNGQYTYLTNSGCAGMATAGSGDVLSGILAAILSWTSQDKELAKRKDFLPFVVASASYINGRAGEIAQEKSNPISMTASDTALAIKDAISEYF